MFPFPFSGTFDLKMGTSMISNTTPIIEIDENYHAEIFLKRKLLQEDHSYYYQSMLPDQSAAWDAVAKLTSNLSQSLPEKFSLTKVENQWTFENRLLNERTTFIFGDDHSLPFPPLDWIGRQVQEDLILLNPLGEIVAGQLCFPSGWSLTEKIGKQFMDAHAPLPSFTSPMIQSANKLIERIPVNKHVVRNNWGFRLGDQLDLSSKHAASYKNKLFEEVPLLTMDTIGEKVFLRVEHQTLIRLPQSAYVLFVIHTYNSSLQTQAGNSDHRSTMLTYLESTPPELIDYKQMGSFYHLLIRYLREGL